MMKRLEILVYFIVLLTFILPDQKIHSQANNSDSITITGQVLSGRNLPLSGVSISLEGSLQEPVISDENGEFKLKVLSGNDWISVKNVGYKDKRIFLNNRTELKIYLTENELKSNNDVIPVVNRSEAERNILSSYYNTELKNIYHDPSLTVDDYLQGRVPGLLVTRISGMPGQGSVQSLRGINSISTNNEPLYIIDGIPLENAGLFKSNLSGNPSNPLSGLSPFDLSNITILKDPIATALYGTKASNGVVLIQTLNPTATKTTIDLTAREGISTRPRFIPQINSDQFKTLTNEILFSSPLQEETFKDLYPGLYVQPGERNYFPYQHNTDWQDYIYANSVFRDYNLQIKGGDEIARYGLSVGFEDHNGVIKNSDFGRYSIRLVSKLNVYSWMRMYISASLNNIKSSMTGSGYDATTSPIESSLKKSPLLYPFLYDDDGKRLGILADADEFGINNPLAIVNNLQAKRVTNRIISSVKFETDISKYIKGDLLIGLNNNNLDEDLYFPNNGMAPYYNGLADNVAKGMYSKLFTFYSNGFVNYERQISGIHKISAVAGFRMNTNTYEEDDALAKNLPANDQFSDLQSGNSSQMEVWGANNRWNWTSVYGNINYIFKDRYLASASLSFDNSTNNGSDVKNMMYLGNAPFGLFYAASIGWRISGESFLKNVSWMDNLLLRASFGKSGNDDIGTVNALDYYRQTNYRETGVLVSGTFPNKSLKNEDLIQADAGFDLSLFGDRFGISANYFDSHTRGMLIYEPLESYMGYENRPTNGGEIENYGLESSFTGRIISYGYFKWDMNLTLTSLRNKVIDISINQIVTDFEGGRYVARPGDPVNSFYGYEYLGVFSSSQEAEQANLKNDKGMTFGAGDAKYKDISGPNGTPDSIIDDYDKTFIGSPTPSWFGGLTNSMNYKRWTFSFTWYFVSGNKLFNYVRYQNEKMTDLSNQSKSVLNRWQFEGDNTDIPRALWGDPLGNSAFSSRWIEDGSFLRLKDITLSYQIQNLLTVIRNAEFFITASNVLTLSKYLGYDPEFNHSFNQMEQGIDYGMIPITRQFMGGMKLSF